ncbi:hypothetical protein [Jannaschia formosa]|uniref:hypothetical protein n=1 Tax=Jannaschia formosa TaxID=2259592 RepID=UPI000E1B7973|nr:hypothetical protein [Jannaschia formosa]TFL18352.1 hypothetical protein DR046_09655 [Jannaschia formosa]
MTELLRIAAPLSLWLASFSAVYGLEGLVCSDAWTGLELDSGAGRAALVAAMVLAVSLQAGLLVALQGQRFGSGVPALRRISLVLGIAALIASVWTLLPVMLMPLCL